MSTITIKKRSLAGWLMWLLIILPFLFGTLNGLLGLPWAIRYLVDVIWVILFLILIRTKRAGTTRNEEKIIGWVITFLICTLLVYLVQYQSAFYYFWGLRNNFRLYVAFFAFAIFLTSEDVDQFFSIFDKLFWLNVIVSLVQYFAFGYKWDYLGGIFGTEKGCNAYTNIFFLIVVTKSIIFYMEKREKLRQCILKCGAAIIVAALAELKFFFVELILVLALSIVFTRFSWRTVGIIVGGTAGVLLGVILLTNVFPDYTGWFSLEWIFEASISNKGYTSSGDLNRLNAIPQINELWLDSWAERAFGLGLGNCDTSSFALVNTPFYEAYSDMHYSWISYAFMYLECGWLGLVFYFGFFALVYLAIAKIERRCVGTAKSYCRLGKLMAILCVVISVYNASLRGEAGYMAYFALAVPFAYIGNAQTISAEQVACKEID